MAMTDQALVSPLDDLYEGLTRALEEEDDRFAELTAELTLEHDLIRASILAARSNIEDAIASITATSTPSLLGRGMNGNNGNGVASAAADRGGVPVVAATDTVVDPHTATVRDFIRAVMRTRLGEVWRAEAVLERMKALGYSGGADDKSRLGTVRATLSQLVHAGELHRPAAGDFVMPVPRQ